MHNNQPDNITLTLLARCEELAALSELPDGILRQYLTREHKQANQKVAGWLEQAGLQHWQDAVGNQWGRLPAADARAPRLILGSHLDTVPYAGAYDGILGVLLGLAVLEHLAGDTPLPFHLDVVGFGDEEGTRFGTTLIGSQALAGQFNPDWLALTDRDGVSMAQALENFGLNPDNVEDAHLNGDDIVAYWEAHIEQGPVLENRQQPLGIVTGIAGAKRARVQITGQAGHAGTTPMNLRRDALAGAAELIGFIEQTARDCEHGEVATVGDLNVRPGAANVISGHCELQLDVRALEDGRRDSLIRRIEQFADDLGQRRQLDIAFVWYHSAPAVLCDDRCQAILTQAAGSVGLNIPALPSGAGHDAMAVAGIAPVGMLFLRSPGGISHHPDESVLTEDVGQAFRVLVDAVKQQAAL